MNEAGEPGLLMRVIKTNFLITTKTIVLNLSATTIILLLCCARVQVRSFETGVSYNSTHLMTCTAVTEIIRKCHQALFRFSDRAREQD